MDKSLVTEEMTAEEFERTWLVVEWMKKPLENARRENGLVMVTIKPTPFGRYVMCLD